MTSGKHDRWTSGNVMPWLLGITLGAILGLALLIIIPRTLGGSAAAAGTASTTESTTASSEAAKPAENAAPAGEANAENGKTFFASACAGCHGAEAQGGVGPKLDQAAAWNMDQFGAAVHEGQAPEKTLAATMPHFTTEQVSAQQLADVHAFLQQTFGVSGEAEAAPAAETTAAAAPAVTETTTTEAETNPTTEPALAAGEGDADAGKEKYIASCAGCHGAEGQGAVGPALTVAKDWTPEQFAAAVREGKAPEKTLGAMMPHFTTEQLSDADLANINAFVKTLN